MRNRSSFGHLKPSSLDTMSSATLKLVAGVDEAGRGPLAGPVVVAAVILPETFDLPGLTDSKVLSREQREVLEPLIRAQAIDFQIEFAEPEEIDRLNILWATMAAVERAVLRLSPVPDAYQMDGNRLPRGLSIPGEAIVKGDGKVAAISAASILAKNARDRVMTEFAGQFPHYGFDKHFGYPTAEHYSALAEYGPCPIHRRSFRLREEPSCPTLDL
jgi:ribonuclease HII